MHLQRILILLLIGLTNFLFSQEGTKPTDKEVAAALRQSSAILKQESKRWKVIHDDPQKNEAKLTENKDSFTINITIDPVVKNLVNDQPIVREYIIPKTHPPKRGILNVLLENTDIYFMGGITTSKDIDIGIMAGYHNPDIFPNLGIGGYVGLKSMTVILYYDLGKLDMSHVIIGAGIGTDYSGTSANFMIGVMI